MYKISFYDWCIKNNCPNLLNYYNLANNELPSNNIGFSTAKKVNFKCNKCSLSWTSDLNHITRRPKLDSCPFCSKRRRSKFYNFKVCYPELAKEWNYKLNKKPPEEYSKSSKKKVYWQCQKGHIWQNSISNRIRKAS